MDDTWVCHVCGSERPDAAISVYARDISARFGLPPGSATENVRYCNDRPDCLAGAEMVTFIQPASEESL